MKKNLLITTALVAIVTSATAAQANSVTTNPWSVELAGGYQFAIRKTQKTMKIIPEKGSYQYLSKESPKVDILSADITGVYNLTDRQALTLRLGYATGDDKIKVEGDATSHIKDKVELFTLMPGYRYTMPVYGDKVKAFAGVNVGFAHVKYESEQTEAPNKDYNTKVDDSDWGFAYSAEIGLRYDVTENVGIFAAYQFSGNTAALKRHTYNHGTSSTNQDYPTRAQVYNGLRAGLSYAF